MEPDVEAAEVKERITGEEMVTKEEITLDTPLSSTGKNGTIKTKYKTVLHCLVVPALVMNW